MSLSDFTPDLALLAGVFVTVLVIMDPVGNVPLFLALTGREPVARQRAAALQAVCVAGGVILAFALFGQSLLGLLGISLESLQVAGGLLLVLIALELLHPAGEANLRATEGTNVALVPLGTPMLAGPGAIAATMLAMREASTPAEHLTVVLAVVGVLAVVYLTLRYSTLLVRLLRDNGIQLITRVMGLLVAAIAVQLIAGAVQQWIRSGVS